MTPADVSRAVFLAAGAACLATSVLLGSAVYRTAQLGVEVCRRWRP